MLINLKPCKERSFDFKTTNKNNRKYETRISTWRGTGFQINCEFEFGCLLKIQNYYKILILYKLYGSLTVYKVYNLHRLYTVKCLHCTCTPYRECKGIGCTLHVQCTHTVQLISNYYYVYFNFKVNLYNKCINLYNYETCVF